MKNMILHLFKRHFGIISQTLAVDLSGKIEAQLIDREQSYLSFIVFAHFLF